MKNNLELNIIDEVKRYDFDQITNWIDNHIELTDHEILDFWNFFTDIAVSLNCDYSGNKDNTWVLEQYEKLCDAVIWNKKHNKDNDVIQVNPDKTVISQILNDGLRIFDKYI